MNFFIIGTEFGIGKTFVTAGLLAVMQSLGYKMGVYKPIQTHSIDEGSFLISPDLAFIKLFDPYITTHATYLFKTQAPPCIAAEIEKVEISAQNIQKDYSLLSKKCDSVIVEGNGGILTPVSSSFMTIDLIKMLQLPVVIVTKPESTSLNTLLLTINKIEESGLPVRGVVINKYPADSLNSEIKSFPRLVEEYSNAKVLGIIREFKRDSIKASTMIDVILNSIDLEKIFSTKIPKLSL